MLLNVLVAIFVGGFLGVVFALIAELINRRVRLPEDLVFAARAPVLGELKRMPAGPKLLGFIPKNNLIAKK